MAHTLHLPGGGADLTLAELQGLAARQQVAMETQQQALVARETRLKYLQQQEARHRQLASEQSRLQRMKERVEAQELKLKKLRALRGQVEQYRANNGNLNSELEAVRALFNEKEKELALAVSKVDQLMRQLQEVQEVKAKGFVSNGNTKGEIVNLELDRLRKELMHRHKHNEQQHLRLEAKRQLLQQRKDDVSRMDTRIQELQQKKRRSQQQQNTVGRTSQGDQKANYVGPAPSMIQHKPGQNIAAIEPYIQHALRDIAKDDLNSKTTFLKQDPKYQILPAHTNVVPSQDNSYKPATGGVIKEVNNNNSKSLGGGQMAVVSGSSVTNVSVVKPVEYKIPSLISSHFDAHRGRGSNDVTADSHSIKARAIVPEGPLTAPKHPLDTSASLTTTSQSTPLPPGSDVGAGSQEESTNNIIKGPRPFKSGLPKWPPEPVKDKEDQEGRQPQINIFDEERQAGSGQSSPASSEGSGPLAKQGSGVFTHPQPPVSNAAHRSSGSSGPPTPQRLSHSIIRQGPAPPPRVPQGMAAVKPVVATAQNEGGHPSSDTPKTLGSNEEADNSKLSINDTVNLGQPQAASTPNSSGTAPTQGHDSTDGKAATGIHLNQRPAPTYRYASKSVIANTYMGRLGNTAMERYQQLNKQLYNTDSQGKTAAGIQTINGAQKAGADGKELHTAFNSSQQPLPADSAGVSTGLTHFGIVGSPNCPDIASDKGSYKANTPKHIRRRHSDSDNEELNKALQRVEKQAQPSLENVTEDSVNNNDVKSPASGSASVKSGPSETQTIPTLASSDKSNVKTESAPVQPTDTSDKRAVAVVRRKKTILKGENRPKSFNRVSFDPLALLLDASLEGELELVKHTAAQVDDVSAPNDEGITALHNAICAGHYDIVKFLVEFGADVNSPDTDGWTPLHCAASCNNLPMVRFLVDHGACIFAATISDNETAAEKCEEDEDGYDGCSDYLYSVQEKLGIVNDGAVHAVFDFTANNSDEVSFLINNKMTVLRKGDDVEKEWWWARTADGTGYIPRNMLGLYPRVLPISLKTRDTSDC